MVFLAMILHGLGQFSLKSLQLHMFFSSFSCHIAHVTLMHLQTESFDRATDVSVTKETIINNGKELSLDFYFLCLGSFHFIINW